MNFIKDTLRNIKRSFFQSVRAPFFPVPKDNPQGEVNSQITPTEIALNKKKTSFVFGIPDPLIRIMLNMKVDKRKRF